MEPPKMMAQSERLRIRSAAMRIQRIAIGWGVPSIGALLARELGAWEEFGYTLGEDSLVKRAVDEILSLDQAPKNEAGRSAVGYGD